MSKLFFLVFNRKTTEIAKILEIIDKGYKEAIINIFNGVNSRWEIIEECSELEHRSVEIIQCEERKKIVKQK